MERPTDVLKDGPLTSGPISAELLYNRYGGMLFSFILQFESDRSRAEVLLEDVLVKLHQRISEVWESGLSLYCWLQREARKIILEDCGVIVPKEKDRYYYSLLANATTEQQWVFRESYIRGRSQEELAAELNKDVSVISGILRDALLIIRKNLV